MCSPKIRLFLWREQCLLGLRLGFRLCLHQWNRHLKTWEARIIGQKPRYKQCYTHLGTVPFWLISANFNAICVFPAPPSPYKTNMCWSCESFEKHSRIWARISVLPVNVSTKSGQHFNSGHWPIGLRACPEESSEWSNLLWEWFITTAGPPFYC